MSHQITSIERLRLQRRAEHVHGLGVRPFFELLLEIAEANECWPDVLRRMDRYRAITPDMLRVGGGDSFYPRQLDVVPL